MTFRLLAAVPLIATACSAPSTLPDAGGLGLEPVSSQRVGAPITTHLFPDYTARGPITPEEWRRLNQEQAPGGALR